MPFATALVFVVDDSLACAPVRGFVRSLRLGCPERTIRLITGDAGERVGAAHGIRHLVPCNLAAAVVTGDVPVTDGARVLVDGVTGSWGTVVPGDAVVRLAPVRGFLVDWAAVLSEADPADLPTSLCCNE